MICPNCQSEQSPNAQVCQNCGANLRLACPVCGAAVPLGAHFCSNCGTRLDGAPSIGLHDPFASLARRLLPEDYAARLRQAAQSGGYERRMVSILFCDIVNFSDLAEKRDPEEVLEIMHGAYPCLIEPIYRAEGTLVQVMGDGLLAFFGTPIAHEDDPQRAIRAGLEIIACLQQYAKTLSSESGLERLNVRVGINTGLVVVGKMGDDLHLEYTALGDAVNLAARLQQNAPPDSLLISHDTYRHVRGVFDVQPQQPLFVKNRLDPVHTYLIQRPKARAWRPPRRGVEGIETRMVGRELEFITLQTAFHEALEEARPRLVVVTGEAGLGKSRMLDEFFDWLELQPEPVYYFRGRAAPDLQNQPYGVLRDVFAYRFDILENDTPGEAMRKFRSGMRAYLEHDQADLVGHLAGFDFSASPAVRDLMDSASFADLATAYLEHYFQGLSQEPVVLLLEDLHWADDSSLDLVMRLMEDLPGAGRSMFFILCAARSQLYERRPSWGEGVQGVARLALKPLTRRASRELTSEILKKVDPLPEDLRQRVVDETEGNPFFIEELVKMLIEGGAIQPGDTSWKVDLERLAHIPVPPTLTSILQARLDSLPVAERAALQRASAIGRVFWDRLIAELTDDHLQAGQVAGYLHSLRERELIFHRERSGVAGAEEYIFKHNLLRDVTYETVLLRQRRSYHARIAAWLEANTGERQGEYLALIAEHYEHSNQLELAADRYLRAGQRAKAQGATREANHLFNSSLGLLPAADLERRWLALFGRDETGLTLGEIHARQEDDAALLALAQQIGDDWRIAEAWSHIAYTAHSHGDDRSALEAYDHALQSAERAGDRRVAALTLPLKIVSLVRLRRMEEAAALAEIAIDHARRLEDPEILARALTNVSLYYMAAGDMTCASQLIDEQVAINHRQGNHLGEAFGLVNLGFIDIGLGRFDEARSALEGSSRLAASLGARSLIAYNQLNLGLVHWRSGDFEAARSILAQSLAYLQTTGDEMGLASNHSYLGLALEASGDLAGAENEFLLASQGFENLGQTGYAADAWAGLARCRMKSGALSEALDYAGRVWALLEEEGSQGLELPIMAYLTCSDVFKAGGETQRSKLALASAHKELTTRAALLSNDDWRQVYLDNIPEHKQVMQSAISDQ